LKLRLVALGVLLASLPSSADIVGASPRGFVGELKLSSWTPLIDREFPTSKPYEATFGGGGLLRADLEIDYELFQQFGTASVAASIGYGEKVGRAVVASSGSKSSTTALLRFLPVKVLATYRFDYLSQRWSIPLVPYVKAGLVMTQWWSTKGDALDANGGSPGEGREFGYSLVAGLALCLDFLDRRMARDFDTGTGINHSYLFAEGTFEQVNNFGRRATGTNPRSPDLSGRYVAFGLALEF
jgi:hypothetical protein